MAVASRVVAVVLTHGHLDHVGRVPLLGKRGFRGPIIGHAASLEIARLIMDDTAKLGLLAGRKPLYDARAVDEVMGENLVRLQYGQVTSAGPFTIQISGLSAHAHQSGLESWFGKIPRRPGGAVFVTHGEEKVSRAYGRLLKDKHGARAIIPNLGDTAALGLRPA